MQSQLWDEAATFISQGIHVVEPEFQLADISQLKPFFQQTMKTLLMQSTIQLTSDRLETEF